MKLMNALSVIKSLSHKFILLSSGFMVLSCGNTLKIENAAIQKATTTTEVSTAVTAIVSNNTSVYNSTNTLDISISATDPSSIVSYRYKIGNAAISCVDPIGYSNITNKNLNIQDSIVGFTSNTTSNNTKLCVVGIDAAGNQQSFASASSVSWITDTTVPTATLTGVPISESNVNTLAITVSAVDASDIATYRYKVGASDTIDCTSSNDYSANISSTTSITDDLTSFDDAPMRLCVVAKDSAGNEQSYASATSQDWILQRSKITTGVYHSCSINREGVLRCWGDNRDGQLGITGSAQYLFAQVIDDGVAYKEVSAGQYHTCGITTSGVLKCWGDNGSYQLGTGDGVSASSPTIIENGVHYAKVSSGNGNTCAITTSGILKCWGGNFYYQLGDGTNNNAPSPIVIESGTSYINITTGIDHTCGITSSGTLKCWGHDNDYQLGDGATNTRATPFTIDGATNYLSVTADIMVDNRTCGITSVGALKCWGHNAGYDLGDGTNISRTTPIVIDSGVKYSQVSPRGDKHACAVTRTGETKCWGNGLYGMLGDGGSVTLMRTPSLVTSHADISSVPTGNSHLNSINLAVTTAIDTETTGYKYKIGTSSIDCTQSAGYSATQNIADPIDESLASLSDGNIRLCLIPVNNLGHSPSYFVAQAYDWTKLVYGSLSIYGAYNTSGSHSFGPIDISTTSTATITFSNVGGMDISNISASNISAPFEFEQGTTGSYPGATGSCGSTITPGSACTIRVSFTPDGTDLFLGYNNTLNINYDNGLNSSLYAISLTGKTANHNCTDPHANNYVPTANVDDGSCTYDCDDNTATNYHLGTGACTYPIYLCIDVNATNFHDPANSCMYACNDMSATNYHAGTGTCTYTTCADPNAINNGAAGSCSYTCDNVNADNYHAGTGACTFTICSDANASNNGGYGACTYACDDINATNYRTGNNSCIYTCEDGNATNYHAGTGACTYACDDSFAINYHTGTGACSYTCDDTNATNYHTGTGACTYTCTDGNAINYHAGTGACTYACEDSFATNYHTGTGACTYDCDDVFATNYHAGTGMCTY